MEGEGEDGARREVWENTDGSYCKGGRNGRQRFVDYCCQGRSGRRCDQCKRGRQDSGRLK